MHLLSEQAKWITISEFVDADGNISYAKGETNIILSDSEIINESWVDFNGKKIINNYKIKKTGSNSYIFESNNPSLGIQKGLFNIDRNIIFSKFFIENTNLNGFEIIIRIEDKCTANGILYDKDKLINTWAALMEKQI